MEANRKENCDFDVIFKEELWHIETIWIQANGEVAWYEGVTFRGGVKFMQIFSPKQIKHPAIEKLEDFLKNEVYPIKNKKGGKNVK